jgi:16S rRNA (guanine527-N7)-methyltransferase
VTAAAALEAVLARAQAAGFLGTGPVAVHVQHAEELAELAGPLEGTWLDLGSGGGVPGLVWLAADPAASAVLVDANARRCRFLAESLNELGLQDRATVRCGRAEALARDPTLRSHFPMVVARGFGPPAVTAECAAGFLGCPGRLVVSEPPAGDTGGSSTAKRWPAEALAALGYEAAEVRSGMGASIAVVARRAPTIERWPRRNGVPQKRPLW